MTDIITALLRFLRELRVRTLANGREHTCHYDQVEQCMKMEFAFLNGYPQMSPITRQVGNTLHNATEQWFPKWDA